MKRKRKKQWAARLSAWMLLISMVSCQVVFAADEPAVATGREILDVGSISDESGYAIYSEMATFSPGVAPILLVRDSVMSGQFTGAEEDVGGAYKTVYRLDKGEAVSFSAIVPTDGAYTANLIFSSLDDSTETYNYAFAIDSAFPFLECEALSVNALWQDDGGVRELPNGDQINPAQKKVASFVKRPVEDAAGIVLTPYVFRLTEGVHTITVTAKEKSFLLAGVQFDTIKDVKPYREVVKTYENIAEYKGEQITVEAEHTIWKSAYSLTSKSDNSNVSVSPSSATNSLINYIGGSTWNAPGEEIAWEINVPVDGLYKLGFAFKQNFVNHGQVYRCLKIDGETPFSEASAIGFSYDTKWQFQSLNDTNGEDCLIYLIEGHHTLSLSVTLADVAEVYTRLKSVVESLGNLYLNMVMISGEVPDPNRDYELQKQIPQFEETLKQNAELMETLSEEIGTVLNVNGELRGALSNMARILNEMHGNLYEAQVYIPTYYTAYQTLSAWLYDVMDMPLSLDQIILAAPDRKFETPGAEFGKQLAFGIQRFLHSFAKDYNSVETAGDSSFPTIKIWVNWGRDQVKVLNTLISESFTLENNVNVLVQQVNATLVQGVISGNSPDLYLHQTRSEPVNLAMRGVLYNLKNFSDYEETLKNFQQGAEIPYLYNGGCYALPDTQAFYVMFYRSDILSNLGVSPPKTWDEFLTATGILQRNKMNTYLPYVRITAATTVNTGVGGLSIFPTMLLQNGGSVYNTEKNATEMREANSIKAFTFWTDFYTKYSLEQDANFYQKFRMGTIPLGIATYTQYLTFKVTAPEIDGKWKIAEIPGEMKDGVLNNICSGSGTGCSIMKSSRNKEADWKFLKWWVSADTQYRYSAEIEAILGESGRTATATVDALSHLSWDSDSLNVINAQWEKVREIPEVPGSYFVSRAVDQAFWAVKNKQKSANEAITDWSEICDSEIARKIKEYVNKNEEG